MKPLAEPASPAALDIFYDEAPEHWTPEQLARAVELQRAERDARIAAKARRKRPAGGAGPSDKALLAKSKA